MIQFIINVSLLLISLIILSLFLQLFLSLCFLLILFPTLQLSLFLFYVKCHYSFVSFDVTLNKFLVSVPSFRILSAVSSHYLIKSLYLLALLFITLLI